VIRTRFNSWLLGVAVLSLLASTPVFAISPSYIMFYGGQLAAPLVLRTDSTMGTGFLWGAIGRREGTIPRETIAKRLDGRPYLNFAVFWGQWADRPIKPADASQHGRLYLPTATEPAVVVASFPAMEATDPNLKTPPAQPIPLDLDEHRDALGSRVGFVAGWVLSAEELATAKDLGVPGLWRDSSSDPAARRPSRTHGLVLPPSGSHRDSRPAGPAFAAID
jgi:hypothetical protein